MKILFILALIIMFSGCATFNPKRSTISTSDLQNSNQKVQDALKSGIDSKDQIHTLLNEQDALDGKETKLIKQL